MTASWGEVGGNLGGIRDSGKYTGKVESLKRNRLDGIRLGSHQQPNYPHSLQIRWTQSFDCNHFRPFLGNQTKQYQNESFLIWLNYNCVRFGFIWLTAFSLLNGWRAARTRVSCAFCGSGIRKWKQTNKIIDVYWIENIEIAKGLDSLKQKSNLNSINWSLFMCLDDAVSMCGRINVAFSQQKRENFAISIFGFHFSLFSTR